MDNLSINFISVINHRKKLFGNWLRMRIHVCRCLVAPLGCFNEPLGNRVFYTSGANYDPTVLTPTTCCKSCQLWGFRYAGLTQGSFCFCSNKMPTIAPSAAAVYCNWPCSGNAALMCGGKNYVRYTRTSFIQSWSFEKEIIYNDLIDFL